jgi:molybdate transport system substrate-binding protein
MTALEGGFMPASSTARAELTVMISGGFSLAYRQALPEFEQTTSISVSTASAASQGTGSNTMKAKLERGVHADVVILSREGLSELIAAARIVRGTDVDLASVPIGAAVRLGQPKPDVTTVDAFKQTLLNARSVAMPGSTSGIFLMDEVLPRLGLADRVPVKVGPRGTDATAMVAAGDADIVLAPVSELVNVAGIEIVGRIPDEVQLIQVFAAAIVAGSDRLAHAKRLIEFLASQHASAAIANAGMEPLGKSGHRDQGSGIRTQGSGHSGISKIPDP